MKYIAFLRAINVGSHTVKMADLKKIFERIGFENVETFIASGNVIFDARKTAASTLEKKIEKALEAALGYEVKTFIRTVDELSKVDCSPFNEEGTVYVGFLQEQPSAAAKKNVQAVKTEVDSFLIKGREVYWLAKAGLGKSLFSGAKLEKLLGMPTTLRNTNTVERLLAKYQ